MRYLKYTLLIAVFLISSCEEFIDRPPLDAIDNDSYWKTSGDLERYVLKYYPRLPSHGNGIFFSDVNSDDIMQDVVQPTLNGERPITTGNWINEWADIRSLNIFFDNYTKVEDDIASYQHYLGEAHFFKAWFYFILLKKYGDIPWYSSSLEPNSEELYKARDPRTLVADSIIFNIDKSIQYLNKRSVVGNARLNKEAALAFKTRVALFEGTWQKYHSDTPFGGPNSQSEKYFQACVEAAEELINGDYIKGIYNTGNPSADYYTLFGLENMNAIEEVLLYRASNVNESLGSNVQFYTTVRTLNTSVTWSLISSYLDKDGNTVNYIDLSREKKGNDFLVEIAEIADPRLQATVWIPGDLRVASVQDVFDKPFIDRGAPELNPSGFQIKKFSNPHSSAAGGACCSQSLTGFILFRYAEVLLNYAEAKYELDGSVAYDALNILRQRVGMPQFKVNSQSSDPNLVNYGYEVSDELYEIRRERKVELALEGHRSEDIRRWAAHELFSGKRPIGYPFDPSEFPNYNPPLNEEGLIDYLQNLLPNGYQFREDQDYLDDIPQDELSLNPNLVQNPGW